ncbi:MAG: GerAB/ArcD/ProY family transporter [Christensenellales bacterium]|jgi:spore germination protein KB
MIVEKAKISGQQLMFCIGCFLISSALITGFAERLLVHDTWLGLIAAAVLGLPVFMVYLALMKKFPGLSLTGMNDVVFGKPLGRFVSVLYLMFFVSLTTLTLKDINMLMKQNIMYNTPDIVIVGLIALVAAWAVRVGIMTVVRYSALFFIPAAAILSLVFVVTVANNDWMDYLPVLDIPLHHFVQGTGRILAVPFLEMVVFLMITPNIREPGTEGRKYMLWGYGVSVIFMLLLVYCDIAALGQAVQLFRIPSFETLRMVNFAAVTSRVEVFFVIILLLLMFLKFAFFLYVTTLLFAQILGQNTYRPFVIIIAVIICVYSLFVLPAAAESMDLSFTQVPILWLFFEMLLPVITLIVAAIRKLPKATGEMAGQSKAAEADI